MAVEVHDNPDEQRYEAVVDGALAGFTAYRTQPGVIAFVHTEVEDAFEGHGVDRSSYAKRSRMPLGEALRFSRSVPS